MCSLYGKLVKAIADIPDDKFNQLINEPFFDINQRIHYLLDENLNNKTVKDDIIRLENHIESLQNDRIETEKLRTVAELLRPFVKQIRAMMINQHVPDCYYSKSIINTFLLHSQGQSISWEIADFNRDNRQNNFDINTQDPTVGMILLGIFNGFELIIKHETDSLQINCGTLLEFLVDKMDRNEAEHDTVKTFLRHDAHGNTSFNEYLLSIGILDAYDMNQKACLESLYRNHFFAHYHTI
ncbi:unnamed protein product [Rotaria socialis]|uniref:Uncharacterized protein n=1 Tax=Rotaria socialis TaxID=392032 RepID=A0A817V5R5_9BILA|nr:unnamed protein product [Rotaria socialis]